jgi:ADP-ribosyl-[dinitrogen reductase] hydrolase
VELHIAFCNKDSLVTYMFKSFFSKSIATATAALATSSSSSSSSDAATMSISVSANVLSSTIDISDRAKAAYIGMMCGDSLSMPVHWYYSPSDITRDFGRITDFQAPKERHPSSIMQLSNTGGAGRGGQQGSIIGDVINHGKKQFWGKPNMHYHQGMKAGENTLNAIVARLLVRTLIENEGKGIGVFDDGTEQPASFLSAYVKFMTTPGSHNDTYAETYHRMFFKNLQQGKAPSQCADDDGHNVASMGGFVLLPPPTLLAAAYAASSSKDGVNRIDAAVLAAKRAAVKQMYTTHNSKQLQAFAEVYAELLARVLLGEDLKVSVAAAAKKCGFDVARLVAETGSRPDTTVIGPKFGSACYIQDSLPSLLFLAYRYADSPELALIANTNAGGENAHRGAALGALMGASLGMRGWPERWTKTLLESKAIHEEAEAFGKLCAKTF